MHYINSSPPEQNGHHFADDIFQDIFLNENVWISIKISLKFVPKGLINNIPALVQIMTWRRPGDKPLSEPMMVILLMHICTSRHQWFKWGSAAWCSNLTQYSLSKKAVLCRQHFEMHYIRRKNMYFRIISMKCVPMHHTGNISALVLVMDHWCHMAHGITGTWNREKKNRGNMDMFMFHTQLWFPASDRDFQRFESDFWYFIITGKLHCGRNRIDHGCPCGMELTLVSLYSTEITCYHSWFLEYKLTHGRPWWILYISCTANTMAAGDLVM